MKRFLSYELIEQWKNKCLPVGCRRRGQWQCWGNRRMKDGRRLGAVMMVTGRHDAGRRGRATIRDSDGFTGRAIRVFWVVVAVAV